MRVVFFFFLAVFLGWQIAFVSDLVLTKNKFLTGFEKITMLNLITSNQLCKSEQFEENVFFDQIPSRLRGSSNSILCILYFDLFFKKDNLTF